MIKYVFFVKLSGGAGRGIGEAWTQQDLKQ